MDMRGGGGENETIKSRSFRDEDYTTRRVFLRSYPLQWGDEEQEEGEEKAAAATAGCDHNEKKAKDHETTTAAETSDDEGMNTKSSCACIKKMVIAAIQWRRGERALVLRRFKHKFTLYFVTCIPVGFNAPTRAAFAI